jgi:hypothetical protein
MGNKSLLLLCVMLSFFLLKEMSNHKVFDNKVICLTEDMSQSPEDDGDTDSEEELTWSGMHQSNLQFFEGGLSFGLHRANHTGIILQPFAEIQSPPPQVS